MSHSSQVPTTARRTYDWPAPEWCSSIGHSDVIAPPIQGKALKSQMGLPPIAWLAWSAAVGGSVFLLGFALLLFATSQQQGDQTASATPSQLEYNAEVKIPIGMWEIHLLSASDPVTDND